MRRLTILISIIALLASSCQNRRPNKSLAEVDSLVVAELYDSAYQVLQTINQEDISDQEDRARYNLLTARITLLLRKTMPCDSLLDEALAYYQQHENKEILTDIYYYKAVSYRDHNENQQAALYFKKAEQLANQTGNIAQQYKICEALCFFNVKTNNNYDLAIDYARKTLSLAQSIGRKDWIGDSYLYMASAFGVSDQMDSITYYVEKVRPLLEYVSQFSLPTTLSFIGFVLRDNHPQEAKKYIIEALKYREKSLDYEYLGEIAYDEGNHEESYRYWKKALTINDENPKLLIYANLIEYEIEHGRTDSISDYLSHIIHIHDSVEASLKNTAVRDIQAHFDQEIAIHEKDQTIIKWQWGILATILVIVVLAVYTIIKRYKANMVLKNYQMQIIDYTNQIREMELASEDYSKQIETLSQEVKQIMDEKSPRLNEGRMLYDCIMESKPIVKWSADDERKFIEYYTATNYRTVDRLRKEPRKEKLTDHKLLYLLLKEMGKTDKEVCDIMGLSDAGLRSIRNRTKPLKEATG